MLMKNEKIKDLKKMEQYNIFDKSLIKKEIIITLYNKLENSDLSTKKWFEMLKKVDKLELEIGETFNPDSNTWKTF